MPNLGSETILAPIKYQDGFSVPSLTKRENKCKQCQNKKIERYHIFKIKMIIHRHPSLSIQ